MRPITIGVAGGTGSGKTTVALKILERVGFDHVAYMPHDAYYRDASDLPPAERAQLNFDHPDSLDNDLMIEHLKRLQTGQATEVPVYDFKTHSRLAETRHVDPQPVIMVEGILIFADKRLRDLMDMKIFVDTDADLRLIRRLQRDIEERDDRPCRSSTNTCAPCGRCTWNSSSRANATPTSSSRKAASTRSRSIWWPRGCAYWRTIDE